MILHTKIVTNMYAKLIDNKGSMMISLIILYLLRKTTMTDNINAINRLNIMSLPEINILLLTCSAIDMGGQAEACPKSKCKALLIHVK